MPPRPHVSTGAERAPAGTAIPGYQGPVVEHGAVDLGNFLDEHAPAPWRVQPRRTPRSMHSIRDANGHVVAYAYNAQVAAFIAERRGGE